MTDPSQRRYEYFCGLELLYLNFKSNKDDFPQSWENFKKNPKKVIITDHEDAKFYTDCEKFTKLIIKTRNDYEELEKRWNKLVSDEKQIREKRNVK
jgi:hypothetical protein